MSAVELKLICKTCDKTDTYVEDTTTFDDEEYALCKHCGAADLWEDVTE
ncbi:hypothetical protein [Paenibacillus harenae]|nr:hypothetical protein [Paenibacillus harenae]